MTPWVTPCTPNSFRISPHVLLPPEAVTFTAYATEAWQGGRNAISPRTQGIAREVSVLVSELVEKFAGFLYFIACLYLTVRRQIQAHTEGYS